MALADQQVQAVELDDVEHRVTPLELFFDLVFVFALTQVTARMAADATWAGLGRGILILAALWWAWVGYSWLTNMVDSERTSTRLLMFAAMAAMLIASLAVPGAFEGDALAFGVAYFVVRVVHIGVYAQGTSGDARQAVQRLAPTLALGPALILLAAAFDGTAEIALWIAALGLDFAGPVIAGVRGYTVHAGHFAERHGLIIIIALGESIVAIGIGAEELGLDAGVIVAAVLGIATAAALWWAYFDVVAPVAEARLHAARGPARAAMARDSYSYLHLPMIAGIVLLALGLKKVLEHVDEPLKTVEAAALCGGAALYLVAHVAFRLRNVRTVSGQRLVAAGACVALIALAGSVDALAVLACLTVVLVALLAFETVRFREARARVRAAAT